MNAARFMLNQRKTALLICDLQTTFAKVIFEFDKLSKNATKLVNACKVLNVPMLITEHYPQSLGKTVPEFNIPEAKGPFSKTQFSMCTPEVRETISKMCSGGPPESIILIGIEAHVCVENTAIDLRKDGFDVHAVADCISSRAPEERELALERMKQMGCVIGTSENIIFKLIKDANHEKFKTILPLVREQSDYIRLSTKL